MINVIAFIITSGLLGFPIECLLNCARVIVSNPIIVVFFSRGSFLIATVGVFVCACVCVRVKEKKTRREMQTDFMGPHTNRTTKGHAAP